MKTCNAKIKAKEQSLLKVSAHLETLQKALAEIEVNVISFQEKFDAEVTFLDVMKQERAALALLYYYGTTLK